MSARYAFAAHPEALADLRTAPQTIRDLALLELQHLVHGHERGAALTRELAGCHKVYVDPETKWRMVLQHRDAPPSSQHRREIYLLALGEREGHAAYQAAALRLERERHTPPADTGPHQRRAHAAQAHSTHHSHAGEVAATAPQPPTPQQRSRAR